jgi:hypothetical protein
MKKIKKEKPTWGWVDDDHISILWNVEDVQTQAKVNGLKLTKAECREVLDACLDGHDANFGISWETLDFHINDMFGDRIGKVA